MPKLHIKVRTKIDLHAIALTLTTYILKLPNGGYKDMACIEIQDRNGKKINCLSMPLEVWKELCATPLPKKL